MSMPLLNEIKANPNIPPLAAGDTVKVTTKIKEGDKERSQVYQGVVIKVRRSGAGSSFTVRRIAYGIGVERAFPLYSPLVEKVEVIRHARVRRAKLYYLRERSGKAARLKERRVELIDETPAEPEAAEAVLPTAEAPAQPVSEETSSATASAPESAAKPPEAPPTAPAA